MTKFWTGPAVLLLALMAITACGGDEEVDLRADPDVQAILEAYEQLGVTDAELDQMVSDIGAALDVIDSETDQREYLRQLRDQAEDAAEAVG